MKKILLGVALIATAFFATSCKNGGNEPDPAKYKVTISDITYNSAHIVIEPADTTVTYFCNVFEKNVLDKYGDAAIDSIKAQLAREIKEYNAELKEMYEYYGMEWNEDEAYTIEDFLSKGKLDATVGLVANKQYYLAFVEMDATGKVNSELYTKPFETPAWKATSNMKIDVKVEGSVITWTADNNNESYYASWVTQSALEYYGFSTIDEYADDDVLYYGEEIEEYLVKGTASDDVSDYESDGYVEKGDKVYAYAFGYKNGARTTDVYFTTFTYGSKSGAPARHEFQPRKNKKEFVRPDVRMLVIK